MPRYASQIETVPTGHRVRTLRRYPGETAERAIGRAARASWWPRRTSDAPIPTRNRWAWIAADA